MTNSTNIIIPYNNQDFSSSTDDSRLVAGSVNYSQEMNRTVSFGQPTLYSPYGYSINPAITRLSESTFVVTYYRSGPLNTIYTRYGSIDENLAITLSDPVVVAQNSYNTTNFNIVGLGPSSFVFIYYDLQVGPNAFPVGEYGYLSALFVSISDFQNPTAAKVVVWNSTLVILPNYALNMSFAVARVDNSTVAVTFTDNSINGGLRCVLLKIETTAPDSASPVTIVQGASAVLSSGQTQSVLPWDLLMDIDMIAFALPAASSTGTAGAEGTGLVVLYADAANGGVITMSGLRLTRAGELVSFIPDVVLGSGYVLSENVYVYGALASGIPGVLALTTAVVGDCSTSPAATSFSTMQVCGQNSAPSRKNFFRNRSVSIHYRIKLIIYYIKIPLFVIESNLLLKVPLKNLLFLFVTKFKGATKAYWDCQQRGNRLYCVRCHFWIFSFVLVKHRSPYPDESSSGQGTWLARS